MSDAIAAYREKETAGHFTEIDVEDPRVFWRQWLKYLQGHEAAVRGESRNDPEETRRRLKNATRELIRLAVKRMNVGLAAPYKSRTSEKICRELTGE